MRRALFGLFVFVIASAFAKSTAPEVTFVSPCECVGFHGKNRWVAKTDLTPVPSDKSAIQSVTPSQIYAWEGLGPDVDLTQYTEARMPSEQKWYALTGRVVEAKVEADGDIHIALQDENGNSLGTVSVEIPVGPKWCDSANSIWLDDASLGSLLSHRCSIACSTITLRSLIGSFSEIVVLHVCPSYSAFR